MNRKLCWLRRGGGVALAAVCAVVLGSTPAVAQCEPDDQFTVFVDDGLVTVIHEHAEYNCCMDDCEYTVQLAADVIEVVETEVVSIPCFCLCCFWLQVRIGDVPPGEYTLRFHWLEGFDTWEMVELPIVVPESGQGDQPSVAAYERSDCYNGSTAVRPIEPLSATWTYLKAVFR